MRSPLAALLLCALGCASSSHLPPTIDDSNPRMVATTQAGQVIETTDPTVARQVRVLAPKDTVMAVLLQVYSDLNIPVGTLQAGEGRIGNLNLHVPSHTIGGKPLSAYLNCGQSPTAGSRADQAAVTISLLSTVVAAGDSASTVITDLTGQARNYGESTDAVHCQSTGVLEHRINIRVVTKIAER